MEENKVFDYSYNIDDIISSWKEVNSTKEANKDIIMKEFICMVLKYEVFPIINIDLKDYDQLRILITKKDYNKYGELTEVVFYENLYDLVEMRKIVNIEHVKFEDFTIGTDY